MIWESLSKNGRRFIGGALGLFFAGIVVLIVWTTLPTRSCYPHSPEAAFRALQCRNFVGENYLTFGDFLESVPPILMCVLGVAGGAMFAE